MFGIIFDILLVVLLIVLAAAAFFLISPVVVGIGLLARNRAKAGRIVLGIYGLLIVSFVVWFLWSAAVDRRSTPGHIARWCKGAGMAQQDVEDQVEDLRHSPSLPKIQSWAIETMRRFRSGQVRTNGKARWSWNGILLAPSEIPEFVSAECKGEISISLSDSGDPQCVIISRYDEAVVIGDQKYRLHLTAPDYQQEVVPGVYAIALYK